MLFKTNQKAERCLLTKVNQTYKDTLFRLSDSFSQREEEMELELKVVVYNINKGMSQDLLENCQMLKEYTQFVQMFRENLRQYEKVNTLDKFTEATH